MRRSFAAAGTPQHSPVFISYNVFSTKLKDAWFKEVRILRQPSTPRNYSRRGYVILDAPQYQ